jgi:chromosome segregation ATPase
MQSNRKRKINKINKKLKTKLNTKDADLAKLVQENEELKATLDTKDANLANLVQEKTQLLQEELSNLQQEKGQLEQKLQTELDRKNTEFFYLQHESDQFLKLQQACLDNQSTELANLKKEKAQLEQKNEELKKQVLDFRQKFISKSTDVANLNEKHGKLLEKYLSKSTDFSDLVQQVTQLQEELANLQQENEELKISSSKSLLVEVKKIYNEEYKNGYDNCEGNLQKLFGDSYNRGVIEAAFKAIKSTCGNEFDANKMKTLEETSDAWNEFKALIALIYNYTIGLIAGQYDSTTKQDKNDYNKMKLQLWTEHCEISQQQNENVNAVEASQVA